MKSPKFILPLVLVVIVVVLANIASTTLFVRADLTRDRLFSLSEASKRTVAELREPLTIKAFFSPELPVPYNNNEQILRDLLDEYAIAGNRFFNYEFTTVPPRSQTADEISQQEDEARKYRIFPIQIQNVQQDEVNLVTAFMGVAILHGDMLETIPAITQTANLEFQITGMIDDMSNKISALLSMRESIDVRLFLSPSLVSVSDILVSLPEELEAAVEELNAEFYGRLDYGQTDPIAAGIDLESEYGATALTLRNPDGSQELAYASIVVSRNDRSSTIDIIGRGILGLQIAETSSLAERIGDIADSLIGIQQEIGYVTGYGSPALQGPATEQGPITPVTTDLSVFNDLVSGEYSLREIDLDRETIPEGLETLVLVSPRERMSDYALFQLDQFVLKGNNLLLFPDSHLIYMPQGGQFGSSQQPIYIPRNTGLEDLMRHFGLELEQGYVMDEQSFVQRTRNNQGGISESTVYFAPIIDRAGINQEIEFLENLPEMVALNISPVRSTDPESTTAFPLFHSSPDGWVAAGDAINLASPFMIQVPPDEEQSSVPMAFLNTAEFESFFAGSDVPPLPAPDDSTDEPTAEAVGIDSESVELAENRLNRGRGTVVVIGGSAMIGSNLVDVDGVTGNSMFVLNLLDYLSDRVDYARMRTKGASFAPLEETSAAVKLFVKTFHIAGLPLFVVLIGVAMWLIRNAKKRSIESRFVGGSDQSDSAS